MTCLKCNNEFIDGDICPLCGASAAHERQKKRAVAVRLGTKGAATKCLDARTSMISFIGNIVLGSLCLLISILLLNLFIVGEWGDTDLPWLNAMSLFLLVPVVYLMVGSILSAIASYKMWKNPDSQSSALASNSCTYLVSLRLIVAVLFIISTFLSLGLSLVLMTSSAGAMNDITNMNEIVLIIDPEKPENDVTFGEYIDNAIADGDTYYVAVNDALELVTETAAMSEIQTSTVLTGEALKERNVAIAYYSSRARSLSPNAIIPDDTVINITANTTSTFGEYISALVSEGSTYTSAYSQAFNALCKTALLGNEYSDTAKELVRGSTPRADLTLIISVNDPEITVRGYMDYIYDKLGEGKSYMVAVNEANAILSANSSLTLLDPDSSDDPDRTKEINDIISSNSAAAKDALTTVTYTPGGLTNANLWLGSMLDFFGAGAHRDVNRFAATDGNGFISWLIAIILPVICGATFYFLPKALRASVVYYEKIHRAKNEGLYEKESNPPSIYLFIFGGMFIVLGIVAFVLTFSLDLIGSVAESASIFTSAVGHLALCLLLVAIGAAFVLNGLHYLLSHKTLVAAINAAEEECPTPTISIPEVVEITEGTNE